jgi:hypothetical protein
LFKRGPLARGGGYRRDLEDAHQFLASVIGQFDKQTGQRHEITVRRREIDEEERLIARQRFVSVMSIRVRRAR